MSQSSAPSAAPAPADRRRDRPRDSGRAGTPASRVAETRLEIEGMSCASCSARVQRTLESLPGVAAASVNLATGTASIVHDPATPPEALARAVSDRGYPARPLARADPPRLHDHAADARALRRAFLWALVLTLPVFAVEMGGHLIPGLHHRLAGAIGQDALWRAEFVLTTLVLVGPGRIFLRLGLPALLRGAPEMNSLVALGALAAWGYSVCATFLPGILPPEARHVYYEAAAVIVTLILLGRWLEARARGRAGEAIRHLVELTPPTALVERPGGPVELPVAELRPGDIVHLRPGERVAVDGVITEGRGPIDESMLTGEPVPAIRGPGERVTGGTINGPAALSLRVEAMGNDTVLARIIALVAQAQAARLPVQALVDRITAVFVPAVMGLALLAFVLWLLFAGDPGRALVAAISVLIIACPCAMGLAVPVSIMVGTGRGAELGILFRRGDALQRLAEARTVALDKTGTLTEGRPQVTRIALAGGAHAAGLDAERALALAAAAEARSEHPLGAAILAAARARGIAPAPARAVEARPGRGLSAEVEGRRVLVGNPAALEEAGVVPDPQLLAEAAGWAEDGASQVHLAVDGAHVAAFGLEDPPRPGAEAAIAELHALGVATVMISGDAPAAAQAIGRRLGIERVIAGVTPEGKLAAIRELGEGAVFVGDGINDAPALAAAATGIAIGTGTDVAIEAAEVVLVSGDPSGIPRALRLSRAVMRNIRQNLFWAFAYNAALIPVAMGALVPLGGPQLSPMLGAGAMALSSVLVVTNALRLRRFT